MTGSLVLSIALLVISHCLGEGLAVLGGSLCDALVQGGVGVDPSDLAGEDLLGLGGVASDN